MSPKEEEEEEDEEKQNCGSRHASLFLPEELIIQVLKDLPLKSALRFRSLSKLWRSVIDNPHLVKQYHLARSHTRRRPINCIELLYVMKRYQNHSYEIHRVDIEEDSGRRSAAASHLRTMSSNLLCNRYRCVKGVVCFDEQLWYPATNQSIRLPPFAPKPADGHETLMIMADQMLFGYDDSVSAFKVLKFYRSYRRGSLPVTISCNIWTQGTSVWRDFDVSNIPSDRASLDFLATDKSCVVGGVIYCLNRFLYRDRHLMLAFDLRQEKLHLLSLPVFDFKKSFSCPTLMDVRGHLGLVDFEMTTIFIHNDVLECGWRKEELLLPREWRDWIPKMKHQNNYLVDFMPTGELLFLFMNHPSLYISISYFCYDLETKKTRNFHKLSVPGIRGQLKDVINYKY